MIRKFDVEMKDGHLRIDIDLAACNLTDVDTVQIGPDPCLVVNGPPDERLIIDICGTRRPKTEETPQTEDTRDA
jgi:hypothetical protein